MKMNPCITLKNIILEEESDYLEKFRYGKRRNSIRKEKHYGYRIREERYGKGAKLVLVVFMFELKWIFLIIVFVVEF